MNLGYWVRKNSPHYTVPARDLFPSGPKHQNLRRSDLRETNIDGLAAIALLGWAAEKTGNKALQQMGRAHATRHIELCVRDDGSVHQSARFDPDTGNLTARFTHKGYSDESTWARAQAWGHAWLRACRQVCSR